MASLCTCLKWLVPLIAVLIGVVHWRYMSGRCRCSSDAVLDGKTVIITGANAGIGRETALDLARRGARVILACRSLHKAEDAAREIRTRTGSSEVVVRHLDLASLRSVREFAKQINEEEDRLDILINNAGVAHCSEGSVTEDNFHKSFGTNHFGHFLLTNLLLDLLTKSAPSRVITVSSWGHVAVTTPLNFTREDPSGDSPVLYPHLEDYMQSKLANVLFGRELAKRSQSSGMTSVSLHPGIIYSSIWKGWLEMTWKDFFIFHICRPFFWLLMLTEELGAQTTLHCALQDPAAMLPGSYYDNCQEVEPSPLAQDDEQARRLWEVSCKATGLQC